MLREDLKNVYLAVISSKRPENVRNVQQRIGAATWYVGYGESSEYLQNGAQSVTESGALAQSHNAALDDAFLEPAPCLIIHDDPKKFCILKPQKEEVPFAAVVHLMVQRLAESRIFKLAGVAPTDNAFFTDTAQPVKFQAFCVGDLLLVKPSPPRFDQKLKLKEDYDFTLQHIQRYGGVVRNDDILASFEHRTNPGGAVAFRNAEREQQAIAYLKQKWGRLIRDNPRRENEILLRFQTRRPRTVA